MGTGEELGETSTSGALALEGGYRVVVTRPGEAGAGAVALSAPGGEVLLSIEMTPSGPAIRVSGASLSLSAPTLSLDCDDLALRARRSASIEVGGELRELVHTKTTEVAARATLRARDVSVEAREGGIDLKANDDIRAQGERVLLNADTPPMPLSWEEYAERRRLAAAGPPLPPGGADADAAAPLRVSVGEREEP